MKETIIDLNKATPEEAKRDLAARQLCFEINQTMPGTEESDRLIRRLFDNMGKRSRINPPLTVVKPHMVNIGEDVVIMNNVLMMGAGNFEEWMPDWRKSDYHAGSDGRRKRYRRCGIGGH